MIDLFLANDLCFWRNHAALYRSELTPEDCHTSFWPEPTWQASLKGSQIQGIWEYWRAFSAVLGSSLSDEMFSSSTWSIHAAATVIYKLGVASCFLSGLIPCHGCCLFTHEMQCCWRFSAAISIGSEGDVCLLRPYFCSVWSCSWLIIFI